MNTKNYKRCEFIIRQFMSVEKPTAELAALFHGWLLDGHNCHEKNVVIRRLFNEALSDAVIPSQPLPITPIPANPRPDAAVPAQPRPESSPMSGYELLRKMRLNIK